MNQAGHAAMNAILIRRYALRVLGLLALVLSLSVFAQIATAKISATVSVLNANIKPIGSINLIECHVAKGEKDSDNWPNNTEIKRGETFGPMKIENNSLIPKGTQLHCKFTFSSPQKDPGYRTFIVEVPAVGTPNFSLDPSSQCSLSSMGFEGDNNIKVVIVCQEK